MRMEKANYHQWIASIIFFSFIVLCVSGIPAVYTDPIPHSSLSIVFYSTLYIAQNALFACLLGLIVSPIIVWVRSVWLKYTVTALLVSTGLFFCFMNAKVYAFWRIYINSDVLQLYLDGRSKVFEVSAAMVNWIWMVVIIFLFIGCLITLFSKKIATHFCIKKIIGIFLGFFLVSQVIFIALVKKNDMSLLQYAVKVPYYYDSSIVHGLQVAGVSLFPATSTSGEIQRVFSDDQSLHYPLHPLQYHLPSHPLNVLLIVVDTLRYDMINSIDMPHVTQFAQHADQFMDNISGGDCTKPGIFSLFYSIPATYWHPVDDHHQGSILIRAFQANHYQFGIYASAPLTSPPFDQTVFVTLPHIQLSTPGATAVQRDEQVTRDMQHFLNKQSHRHRPFFGFIFYDAPHAYNALPLKVPFYPTRALNYFTVNNRTVSKPIFNLYKNAVFFDDEQIYRLITTLKTDHLLKNTIVIITSDHGQEFNEYRNDYWEHASGFSKYQVRTPMIIAWPHRAPHVYTNQTTHYDIAPTLLKRVLGVRNPTRDYSIGDDIFSKKQLHSVITGNYAYFALVSSHDMMQFHYSGLYRFTNLEMKPIHQTKHDTRMIDNTLHEMTRFSG